jgi:hypothetical protein
MVHARIDAIEHLCKYTVAHQWLSARLLCPVVVGHPLEEPRVGVIMAGYFEVDEHAPPHESGAMLESLLASTRRNPKRCETEAL